MITKVINRNINHYYRLILILHHQYLDSRKMKKHIWTALTSTPLRPGKPWGRQRRSLVVVATASKSKSLKPQTVLATRCQRSTDCDLPIDLFTRDLTERKLEKHNWCRWLVSEWFDVNYMLWLFQSSDFILAEQLRQLCINTLDSSVTTNIKTTRMVFIPPADFHSLR